MEETKDNELELERLMGKIRTINSLLRDYPDDIHIGVKKKEPPVSLTDDRPVYTEIYVSLEKEIAIKFLDEYRDMLEMRIDELSNSLFPRKDKRVIYREISAFNDLLLMSLFEGIKEKGGMTMIDENRIEGIYNLIYNLKEEKRLLECVKNRKDDPSLAIRAILEQQVTVETRSRIITILEGELEKNVEAMTKKLEEKIEEIEKELDRQIEEDESWI